jgi:diguanylate cyclase (GGDEF)-like protein
MFKTLKNIMNNLVIRQGIGDDLNAINVERKRALVVLFLIVGNFVLLIMSVIAFLQGNILLAVSDVFVSVGVSSVILFLFKKYSPHLFEFVVGIISLFFIYLFIIGGVNNTAHLWCLCFPMISYLLLDYKKGTIYSVIFSLVLIGIEVMAYTMETAFLYTYGVNYLIRFFAVYFLTSCIAFSAVRINSATNEGMSLYQNELRETIAELEKTRAQLRELTISDPLTMVYNKRYLLVSADSFYTTNPRGYDISVFIDIDDFKKYNDYYGHIKGDEILQDIVKLIRKKLIDIENVVVRFGGEEIVILLKSDNIRDVENCAQSIIDEFNIIRMPHIASKIGYVTVSMGIVVCESKDYTGWEHLIEISDAEMYKAKRMGKNQYSIENIGEK